MVDTGIGIPADRLDRLFKSFTQADESIHSRFGGTGLGLAISKELVQLMGGKIWVESELGKGSKFSFVIQTETADLPRSAPRTKPLGGPISEIGKRLPMKILAVEDNPINQKLIVRLLQKIGYVADVAGNGLEAVEAVKRQPYDIIFMDVQMPEMNGFEATQLIRKKIPQNQQPRIVAMTANAMQGDRENCLQAGMDDYISKPVLLEDLIRAIQTHHKRATAA